LTQELTMNTLFSLLTLIGVINPTLSLVARNFPYEQILPKQEIAQAQTIEVLQPKTQKLWTVVTAYSSTPQQTDDTPFITAQGTCVRDGIVAANFLPFGTKIKLPELYGDKVFTVEDRMHQRFSDRIDVWLPDETLAKNFGKRHTLVEIEL